MVVRILILPLFSFDSKGALEVIRKVKEELLLHCHLSDTYMCLELGVCNPENEGGGAPVLGVADDKMLRNSRKAFSTWSHSSI